MFGTDSLRGGIHKNGADGLASVNQMRSEEHTALTQFQGPCTTTKADMKLMEPSVKLKANLEGASSTTERKTNDMQKKKPLTRSRATKPLKRSLRESEDQLAWSLPNSPLATPPPLYRSAPAAPSDVAPMPRRSCTEAPRLLVALQTRPAESERRRQCSSGSSAAREHDPRHSMATSSWVAEPVF